jgi:hypothetical protein
MNKPTSQRQTVERPNDNDASYRSSGGAKNIVSFGAWLFRSYTNDVAPATETCQAPPQAKTAIAD